jgi:putative transposase
MARLPRLYAPGVTQLAIAEFADSTIIYPFDLINPTLPLLVNLLGEASKLYGVAIHGWSITPKAILLLATPQDAQGISKLIQSLGRHLAATLKSGAVFSGRYRSTLLEPGVWVLPALLWLERQSVREQPATDPELWTWSSVPTHTGAIGLTPIWLKQHLDYWACGNTPFDRQATYRQRLQEGNAQSVDNAIEKALRSQWPLGGETFLNEISPLSSRRVRPAKRGRPRSRIT